MAFPLTQLPLRVRIAPGASPGGSITTWPSWVDISADVRVADGVAISDGRANEASKIDASSLGLTLDNRSGNYVPRNPLGAYYGGIRRNTPIKVGTVSGLDTFTRTVSNGWGTSDSGQTYTLGGAAANYATTGTAATWVATAANVSNLQLMNNAGAYNGEGRARVSVPVVATGAGLIAGGILRYGNGGNDYYLFQCEFTPAGTVVTRVSRNLNGVFSTLATSASVGTYTAGQTYEFAWSAVGGALMAKAWPTSGSEPSAWSVTAIDTAVLKGRESGLLLWRLTGNTNAGSVTYTIDNLTFEAIEFVGNVAEWPTRWDQSGKDSTAPIRASGILRRLAQGNTPLKSPLFRQLSAQNTAGYWTLEDDPPLSGVLASSAGSSVAVAPGASVTGVQFGADTTLAGSLQNAKLTASNSRITAKTPRRLSGTTGFSAMIMVKLNATPGGSSDFVTVAATGLITKWVVRIDTLGFTVQGYQADGTMSVAPGPVSFGINPLNWFAIQVETEIVGANTNWAMAWHEVGRTDYFASSGSYASTVVSNATSMTVTASSSTVNAAVSHIWLGANTLPFVANSFSLVSNGYIGETAAARAARLGAEEGVPIVIEAGTSKAMGQQRTNALLPLLRECEEADYGVLYEAGGGLGFRPGSARYSPPVTIALDRNLGHIAAPPEPTDDDQQVRNDMTASRDGGAQGVRYVDTAHVAANGRYDDGVTLNIDNDDDLIDHAAWRVYIGTRDLLRWPRISLDLARNPTLLPAWRSRLPWGARMTISNELAQVAGNGPDVIIEGVSQTLGPFGWDVELNCSPAKPFDVAPADDALFIADSETSLLVTGVNSTATSLSVSTASTDKLWILSSNPLYANFNIIIGGEVMTVTAVTGATSPQTLTVTRSVNGIVKAQVAGQDVRVAVPTPTAL